MGVEYRHFVVVDQDNWHPATDTFERVNEVLGSWGLNDRLLEIVDLEGGKLGKTSDASIPTGLAGKAFKFAGPSGSVVTQLAGPSLYNLEDEDRYLAQVLVILGEDYRIHWSSEAFCFERIEPSSVAHQDEEPYENAYAESLSSRQATNSPKVRLHVEDYASKHLAFPDYKGYWRAAVILDFGKDLPVFSDGVHALPSKDFVKALQQALRAQSIVEVGEFY